MTCVKRSTLSKTCEIQHNDSLVYDGALSTFFQQIVRCGGFKDTYILVTSAQNSERQRCRTIVQNYRRG